jgi:hypothetical protein
MKHFYNGYELTSWWFSFMSENSDKVETKHTALYLYIVEMFNKRNWVETIGLPTDFTMGVLNISSYKTYSNTLNDLIEFGFIKLVEKSKNQHTSNKVALVKNAKASSSHIPKQIESNDQSKLSITKLINNETIKLINSNVDLLNKKLKLWIEQDKKPKLPPKEIVGCYKQFAHLSISNDEVEKLKIDGFTQKQIDNVLESIENYKKNTSYVSLYLTAKKWLGKEQAEKKASHELKPVH